MHKKKTKNQNYKVGFDKRNPSTHTCACMRVSGFQNCTFSIMVIISMVFEFKKWIDNNY